MIDINYDLTPDQRKWLEVIYYDEVLSKKWLTDSERDVVINVLTHGEYSDEQKRRLNEIVQYYEDYIHSSIKKKSKYIISKKNHEKLMDDVKINTKL